MAFRITLPVPEIWSLAEMLVCVVARAPGMWQNIEKRSFDIINFTEIAWIFHNKVRYSTYIYIYVCIILYIYIYTYYQKRVSPFFMLSPGTLPKLRQPWSLLWRWLASVGLCQGPRWDMMGQNGGDCLSHYHPLKCHWVGLKIVVPPNFDGLSFINVYHQGPHWSWQKSYNKYS